MQGAVATLGAKDDAFGLPTNAAESWRLAKTFTVDEYNALFAQAQGRVRRGVPRHRSSPWSPTRLSITRTDHYHGLPHGSPDVDVLRLFMKRDLADRIQRKSAALRKVYLVSPIPFFRAYSAALCTTV